MTPSVLVEVVETYRARQRELWAEAINADATRRPDLARDCRSAWAALELAIADEIDDQRPPGIGSFESLS